MVDNSPPVDEGSVTITLRYRVYRSEISSWYWTTFFRRDGLWWYWLGTIVFVFASYLYIAAKIHLTSAAGFAAPAVVVLSLFGFYVVYPQIAYKARERTLIVSSAGIETRIGSMSGRRSWKDISYITDRGSYIAIVVGGAIRLGASYLRTQNGNAFVVPNRAFANSADRDVFLRRVAVWHAAQAKRFPHLSKTRLYAEASE